MGLLLATLLTAFSTFIGFAFIVACTPDAWRSRFALFSPAVGVSALVIPGVLLSQAGFAAASFTWPLVCTEVVLASMLYVTVRPSLPNGPYVGILCGVLLGTALVAWPFAVFGFDWVGYISSDMVNYASNAQNLIESGILKPPTFEQYVMQSDWARTFWWFINVSKERFGADMFLAETAYCLHITPLRAFMIVMTSQFQATMLCASGLVWQGRRATAAVLTTVLIATSAVVGFGIMACFLGQTVGLPILLALVGMTTAVDLERKRARVAYGLLLGALAAGLLNVYPELLPFWIVAVSLALLQARRDAAALGVLTQTLAICAVTAAAFAASRIATLFTLGSGRAAYAFKGAGGVVGSFPYVMIPEAAGGIWGLTPWLPLADEPAKSLAIAAGLILSAVALIAVLREVRKGEPVGVLAAVFVVGFFGFAYLRAGYIQLKFVLYAMPFLYGAISLHFQSASRTKLFYWQSLGLACIIIFSVRSQQAYVERSAESYPLKSSTFIEVAHPASTHLLTEAEHSIAHSAGDAFLSDATRGPLAFVEALSTRGRPAIFPWADIKIAVNGLHCRSANFPDLACAFQAADKNLNPPERFRMPGRLRDAFHAELRADHLRSASRIRLLATTQMQSVINRRRIGDQTSDFVVLRYNDISNHLIFVNSGLGYANLASLSPGGISYSVPEVDYYYPSRSMSAVGRYLLFEVLKPTLHLRLIVDFTASLLGDGNNAIPPMRVIGRSIGSFHASGHGSGRYLSDAIEAQKIDGHAYVLLDLGRNGELFAEKRTFLSRLWGGDVRIDLRRLNGFVRDISAVNASMSPYDIDAPSQIATFPRDLGDQDLFYSGMYEDGWVSHEAKFYLRQPSTSQMFEVRGSVPEQPDAPFGDPLRTSIDGRLVDERLVDPGRFDIRIPMTADDNVHLIELRFRHEYRLPGDDRRPASAKIEYVGFPSRSTSEGATSTLSPVTRADDQIGDEARHILAGPLTPSYSRRR